MTCGSSSQLTCSAMSIIRRLLNRCLPQGGLSEDAQKEACLALSDFAVQWVMCLRLASVKRAVAAAI